MAIYSPLRYRRLANRQTEKTTQLIGFRLRQQWLALPIDNVYKVIPTGKVYAGKGSGTTLTNYEGQEFLVVDVYHQIFAEESPLNLETGAAKCMAIVISNSGELVGLPMDSPPSVFRIPESAFTPLEKALSGSIQCISSTMAQTSDRQPLFLLDIDLLFERAYSS